MKSIEDKALVSLLLKSIKEICTIREAPIVNYKDYPVHMDLLEILKLDTEEKYIHFYEHDEQGKVLSIQKPKYTSCPKPDNIIENWLNTGWNDYEKEASYIKNNEETGENFQDVKERVISYEQWIKQRNEWVNEQRRLKKIDRLFMKFYAINNSFHIGMEENELLFAFGVFKDARKRVAHPLFTKKLRITDEDIAHNVITLYDANDNIKLDVAFLNAISDNEFNNIGNIIDEINTNDIDVYNQDNAADFLRRVIHWLTSKGEYCDKDKEDFYHYDFIVTYCPIIIMRTPKSGLVNFVNNIQEAIENGIEIPAHFIDIVHPIDKEDVISYPTKNAIEDKLAAISGEDTEIYMTKPANKEQLRIAREIEQSDAVEVQGPPGTGKTHTIANLIGHFLAQGKTVLVTSEKVKALTVLKDKLEEEIQPLCVPVFDNNQREMESSVNAITGKINQIDIKELQNKITVQKLDREKIIHTLNEERKKIFEIRNREAKHIVYDGENYSVLDIAKFIAENKNLLDYIPGKVEESPDTPLTIEEFKFLYECNKKLSVSDCAELSLTLPSYSEFILPEKLEQLLQDISNYDLQTHQIKNIDFSKFEENFITNQISYKDRVIFSNPDKENLHELQQLLKDISTLTDWQISVIQDVVNEGGYRLRWEKLLEAIDKFYIEQEKFVGNSVGVEILISSDVQRDLQPDIMKKNLIDISQKLQNGGKIGKMYRFLHGTVKKILEGIHINGHEIQNSDEAKLILDKIRRDEAYERLKNIWNDIFKNKNVSNLDDINDNLINYIRIISKQVKRALKWEETWYVPYVNSLLKAGFNKELLISKEQYSLNVANYIEKINEQVNAFVQLALLYDAKMQIKHEIHRAEDIFCNEILQKSKYCQGMLKALKNYDSKQYACLYQEYVILYDKTSMYRKRNELLLELRQKAACWAKAIQCREGVHNSEQIPYDIKKAWKTKQFDMIFRNLFSESLVTRQKKVETLSSELRKITAKLASDMAWLQLKKRLEGKKEIQANLGSWISLIKRIGKNTGKNAPLYRHQAQQCMLTGQKAIPAWIVPVKRALDMFNPSQNHFDIAIVDEASQSSLEALAITFLANKIIVVGDDRQVSPMNIGMDISKVNDILKKYLAEYVKDWALFNGKTSFYELVGRSFQPLMLREHFRCVPEIIGYSNEKFYDNQILPLRDASSSQLVPPVINYRVDGIREGKTNEEEAETIISLLMACCEQKEYENKTFGVISLLGDEQAQKINDMISRYIKDYAIIKKRMLIAGNAASFQGDERDVIFLSLVDDMGSVRKSTTDDTAKRFNVAVSRARDQLWVVNSLDYTALQTDDLKYGLLEYAANYEEHRKLALDIQEKSESPFECEVAQFLSAAGYHFIQQYEVGAYRIDIVVIYGNKKIAVECDGEQYHSGEIKIQQDMERQCILERVGWKFIRIPGGIFYRDKEKTMQQVYKQFQEYGIFPETIERKAVDKTSDLIERVKRRAREIRKNWNNEDNVSELDCDMIDEATECNEIYSADTMERQHHHTDNLAYPINRKKNINSNSFKEMRNTTVTNKKKKDQNINMNNTLEHMNENDIVIHKMFGEGRVKDVDGSYINVVFQDMSTRKFQVPQAFKAGFLKLKKKD